MYVFYFQQDQSIYQQKVKDMIADGDIRLIVNINDLRKKNPKRATEWAACCYEIEFTVDIIDFMF